MIHSWFSNPNGIGGSTLHVYDLIKTLGFKYNFHIFVPSNESYKLYSYCGKKRNMMEFIFSETKNNYFCTEYRNLLYKIIKIFRIDFIHIHHMRYHYFDTVDIINELDIPSIISLHDFYCICPTMHKVNYKDEYCGYPSPEECNVCLSMKKNNYTIDSWRDVWTRLFNCSKVLIAPSESARKEIIQNFPELSINVIGHGIPLKKKTTCLNIDDDEIFNIAFIGEIYKIKGESIIRNLLSLPNKHIVFHLFGHIESPECIINKNIIYHNKYKREELNKLFQKNKIKLVCIFSICPETFSYTFFEAIANNIPILAIDLGNVGQKIKEHNLGWLIKQNTELFEISNTLMNIFNSKNEYKLIAESGRNFKIKTIKEMGTDYDKIYSAYPKRTNNKLNEHDIYFSLKENYLRKQKLKKEQLITKIKIIKTKFKGKGFIYTIKFIICKIIKK
jgi:hypothetical protein